MVRRFSLPVLLAYLLHVGGDFIFGVGSLRFAVPLPYVIVRYLPLIKGARVAARFDIMVALGLAVLSAYGVRYWLERAERPSRWMAAIVLLVALEYLKVPYPIAAVDILDAYQEVARDRRNVVVMDVPLGWRTGWGSTGRSLDRQQLFQIVHGKRLLGGFASRVPEDELMVTSLSESDSGNNTQTVLPDMDIRDSALQPRYTAVRITQRAVDELSSEGLSTEVLRAIDSIKGRMFVYEVPLFQALNLDSTHKCNSSAGCQESGQPI